MFRKFITSAVIAVMFIVGVTGTTATKAKETPVTVSSAQAPGSACPTSSFLDVSQYEGAGGNYARPSLSVSCDGTHLSVKSNNIPHYKYQQMTPNALTEKDITFQVPLTPQYSDQVVPIPILGPTGVAINGLTIAGPNEATMPNRAGYGDPVYNGILDYCKGHTSPSEYHYHALVQSCFYPNTGESTRSPILGYALDGFPIYGPYGCVDAACSQVVKFKSSYDQTGDPTNYAWDAFKYSQKSGVEYLDQCNGRTEPDGSYGYHVTDTFPYIMGCYHGVVNAVVNGRPITQTMGWDEFKASGRLTSGGQGGGQGGMPGQNGGQGDPNAGGQGQFPGGNQGGQPGDFPPPPRRPRR